MTMRSASESESGILNAVQGMGTQAFVRKVLTGFEELPRLSATGIQVDDIGPSGLRLTFSRGVHRGERSLFWVIAILPGMLVLV